MNNEIDEENKFERRMDVNSDRVKVNHLDDFKFDRKKSILLIGFWFLKSFVSTIIKFMILNLL